MLLLAMGRGRSGLVLVRMVSPVVGLPERVMLTMFRHRLGLGYAVVRYKVGAERTRHR